MRQARILIVDDQWGQSNDPQIPTLYGSLPYAFLLESSQANDGRFQSNIAVSGLDRMMARSTTLRTSRTFPGQW